MQALALTLRPPKALGSLHAEGTDGSFTRKDRFWNADIRADIILSYPSLLRHNLGVLPHRGSLVREPTPDSFHLLGDGRPSEWVQAHPDEGGPTVKNVSAWEWHRSVATHRHPAGLDPAQSAPPPWDPPSLDIAAVVQHKQKLTKRKLRKQKLTKQNPPRQNSGGSWSSPTQWDCLAPRKQRTRVPGPQNRGVLPYGPDRGTTATLLRVREGPGVPIPPAMTGDSGDLDPRCFQISRMVVSTKVPREALQPSCPAEPKVRRGTDTDHGSWTTSEHRVVDEVRDGIIATLDAGTPTVGAFAFPVNARFPRFWTRHEDAFDQDWSQEKLLWINPPFEHF